MRGAALSILLGVLLLAAPGVSDQPSAPGPKLVLVLAVDQLRPDRLDTELPGGLGRLLREGRFYPDAALEHAITETCPGYATMLTGHHPSTTGLVGNRFFDLEADDKVYCVNDPAEESAVLGVPKRGRSPRNLLVSGLGDWMKQTDPASRVFTVAGKDRAAVALGGQRPNAAYWFSENDYVGFTSSRYYLDALPGWVERFNGEALNGGFFEALPDEWEHRPEAALRSPRADDFRGESDSLSRTSPHPLRDGDAETFAEQLFASPFIDDVTLAFATELVREEGLGRGPAPDLLALGLSATDIVGHRYGPFSHESADALLRLDASLDGFLKFLEAELGEGSVLVALTADHGVLPLPEWLRETGESQCALEDGRHGLGGLGFWLLWRMHWKLSPFRLPRGWLLFAGNQAAVKRGLLESRGVELDRAVGIARDYLARQQSIEHVWTREEIERGEGEIAQLYRNSYHPQRSGDLMVQLAPTCLISFYDEGTTHGTPYPYDRRVPLLFWGEGVLPGAIPGPAATVDIAPTLAGRLGVATPPDLAGRVLFD
ncbi:MAG: alkaline phosphatase family protein [Myxococcota bacterium]